MGCTLTPIGGLGAGVLLRRGDSAAHSPCLGVIRWRDGWTTILGEEGQSLMTLTAEEAYGSNSMLKRVLGWDRTKDPYLI